MVPAGLWRLVFLVRKAAQFKAPPSKTLLIVRVDAIGDYVLFRNVLPSLKQSPQYAGYRFSLLGNVAWRPLAEALDADVFDEFLWIEPTRYSKSVWYRAATSHRLVHQRFEILIHPPFSRTYWSDKLVRDLVAGRKIASVGDSVNNSSLFNISRTTYTQLVPTGPQAVLFEFLRNREFVEGLLGSPVAVAAPSINLTRLPSFQHPLPPFFAVFHMDASRRDKEWPQDNFVRLAAHLLESTSLSVVLLGKKPTSEGTPFSALAPRLVDLREETTLVETASILSRASLFVGNDSALLHIALAVGVPGVVGIAFGQHFGRFVPYPENQDRRMFFLFPSKIAQRLPDEAYLKDRYKDGSFEDIKTVSFDSVLEKVNLCLQPDSKGNP